MRIIYQPEKSLTSCPCDKAINLITRTLTIRAIHFPHTPTIKNIHDLTNPINIQYLHVSAGNHSLAPIYR